jgi:Protein of unknown function (DUF1045)
MERHAIYYVPAVATLWWKLGSQWLSNSPDGFDSIPEFRGINRLRREQLIRKPAGYGWHATLVAPFHLRADRTQEEFSERLRTVAAQQRPFELKVRVGLLSGFAAILPAPPSTGHIDRLASTAVTQFDEFRAPLTLNEYKRRRTSICDSREIEHLERWGYPYVFDRYRFHMTLTDQITPLEAKRVLTWWNKIVDRLGPLPIDEFSWCVEPQAGAPFAIRERFRFGTG